MLAVEVSDLNKTFSSQGNRVHALKGVSVTIKEGEIFGLLGPNGAGKTTLISVLAGVTSADSGSVKIFGKDIVEDLHEIQQFTNVVRGFGGVLHKCSVIELMRYYALLYNVPNKEERIEHVLKMLGLWGKRDQYVSHLSSGWRQRFFIAKALLNTPKMLLLDEPTVGLDVDMALIMRSLIKKLQSEGYTILLTTHYMQEADELCDRIALISDGTIVAQGTSAKLKALVREEEAIEINGLLPAKVKKRLTSVKGVLRVSSQGVKLRLLVQQKSVMNQVIKVLSSSKASVASVRLVEPTLEDVFLKLTKRGLDHELAE